MFQSSITRLVFTLALSVCAMLGAAVLAAGEDARPDVPASGALAESGASGRDYNAPPLQFEPKMFLFTLIVFGLYVLGTRTAVWQPLVGSLNTREGRIARAEALARGLRREVEQLRSTGRCSGPGQGDRGGGACRSRIAETRDRR